MQQQWWPWLLRVSWLALPFAAGPLFGDALDDASRAVQLTGTIGLWTVWAAALTCMFIPLTTTLTPVRIVAPASVAVAVWATIDAGASGTAVVALVATSISGAVAMAPQIGIWFVNGSSYGDERRMLLRPPFAILLGPLPLAWAVVVAPAAAMPLLLAAEQWILGALVGVVGIAAAVPAVRALHALARRWLVFVPAGLVVHDLMVMAEPVLMKRGAIERFGPALATTTATDLTMGATGLVLEAKLRSPAGIAVRPRPGGTPAVQELDALLVAPTLPGVVLDEAEKRRITVG